MARKIYTLGYCDYNDSGRKNCLATFEWELTTGGRFSMSGNIWNPRQTDIYTGGQCCDEILKFFPDDEQAKRMVEVWEQWHLNDMQAGSPAQEAWLAQNPKPEGESDHYKWAIQALRDVGLNPDPNYLHEGKPYEYGSAWLKQELPAELVEEIRKWAHSTERPDPFSDWLAERYELQVSYQGEEKRGDRYFCRIVDKKTKQALTTDWWQGVGHRKDQKGREFNPRVGKTSWNTSSHFSPTKSAPDLKSVVASVLMDAQAYAENGDVADFIENYGYKDFREGRRAWQACEKAYCDVKDFFGPHFQTLLHSEDLP